MIVFLVNHWLEVLCLLFAGGMWLWPKVRPQSNITPAPILGFALALFALGSAFLSGWKFRWEANGDVQSLALWLIYSSFGFGFLLAFFLIISRRWSFTLGVIFATGLCLSCGAYLGKVVQSGFLEAGRSIAWLEFLQPWWLTLLVFVPVVWMVSRRSLSGLGRGRRRFAITARMLVVALLVLALAEPRFRRPSDNLTVLFVVDRSFSVPQDLAQSVSGEERDRRWERVRKLIEDSVSVHSNQQREDQFGVLLFGKRPRLLLPPAPVMRVPIDERRAGPLDGNYTDIAAALKLALASFPEGTSRRIVLLSDGNANLGNTLEQVELARNSKIPIDTVALAAGVRTENEVLVQSVEAPTVSAEGDRRALRVVVRNESPTSEVDGYLELVRMGRKTDQDAVPDVSQQVQIPIEEPQDNRLVLDNSRLPARVRLLPGPNRFRFIDTERALGQTSYTYQATFTPIQSRDGRDGPITAGLPGDRPANNKATAAVVVRGQRKLLFLDQANDEAASQHKYLLQTLRNTGFQLDYLSADRLPNDNTQLGVFLSNYDCLLMANVPADFLTNDQMDMIRTQVSDQGCGLVMVGGPDSFGPGGYQGTPVEAALPVDCEIKSKQSTGRGGLVLIMHASEMADGNSWQKIIAKMALQRLGPADMVGVVDFGFLGGSVNWQIPFQEVGLDKSRLLNKVDRMNPGDMPDFDPFLVAAADTLSDPKHELSVKHAILISDGDPQYSPIGQAAIAKMAKNGITCTTIGVATHGVNEDAKMKLIAGSTSDGKGKTGNFYKVADPRKLPAIYIKESRRISQSFIYDKVFTPQLRSRSGATAGMPDQLPTLKAFVRTTAKSSPLLDLQIDGPIDPVSKEEFPVLASWRYGLGKAVAYTSDARSNPADNVKGWDEQWAASEIYAKFWEQTVSWAMREAERGKMLLFTEYRDGRIKVIVDARDEKDQAVLGLSLKGAVTLPSKPEAGVNPPELVFKPSGIGRYEAEFPAEEAGAYFLRVEGTKTNGEKLEVFDTARSGVTVPYSPEFSDLETDTPILKQIAEETGGNAYTDSDDFAQLVQSGEFFRPAPQSIRAILPFWYWLVFAAALLLVFDVAIRRISIEAKEIRTNAEWLWAKLRHREYEVEEEDTAISALMRRKQQVSDTLAKKVASRKFEAAEDDLPAPEGADAFASRTDEIRGNQPKAPSAQQAEEADADDEDDFLSRMKKARDRGRKKSD